MRERDAAARASRVVDGVGVESGRRETSGEIEAVEAPRTEEGRKEDGGLRDNFSP